MMPRYRQRSSAETRRADISRVNAMTVKVTDVSGRVLLKNPGEALVETSFPVKFTEPPIMSFGGALDTNSNEYASAGKFPTISVVVVAWRKERESSGFDGYYTGATLAIVATGKAGQRVWIHWTARGHAIRNPVNAIDDIESEI